MFKKRVSLEITVWCSRINFKNIARNNFIRNLISRLSFSASWVKKRKLSVFLVFTHRNGGTVPLCLLEYYNGLLKYS